MIDGVIPNLNPISYDKTSAPATKLNLNNIIASDVRSFVCKIGQTTNYSTKFISMLAQYEPDSPEYEELIGRIKQLRRYIGDSIDSAKGIKTKPFPSEWKKKYKYLETDTEDIRKEKYFYNSLVGRKKPYFFIYIYNALYAEYRKYKKNYNTACKELFNCKMGELLMKQYKTDDEKKFVREYYQKMPVTKTNCVINRLCWMIEGMELKYKHTKIKSTNPEIVEAMIDQDIEFNKTRYNKVKALYLQYKREYNKIVVAINSVSQGSDHVRESSETGMKDLNFFYTDTREKAQEICSNAQEFANYAVMLCYQELQSAPKDFVWTIAIEGLLKNLEKNKQEKIEVPIRDINGETYLGAKYSLAVVSCDSN